MKRTLRCWCVALVCLGCAGWAFSIDGNAQGRGGARGDVPVAAGGAQAQPPQKGTALVLGQVVDATSGQPISEATVTVQSRIPVASLATATSPTGPLRLITGADGQFVLHDLPKTNLLINVTAPGYVAGIAGQSRPGGTSRPVEIEDGQRLTDFKVKLWKYAVVTGTVTDDAGEPAVGIMVQAIRRATTAGRQGGGFSGSAMTDDRGVYRLSTLTPGDYVVAIQQTTTTMPTAAISAMLQSVQSALPAGDLQDFAASEMASSRGGGMRVGNLLVNFASGATPALSADGRLFAYQSVFYPSATTSAQATLLTLKSGEERMGIDLQMKVIPTMRVSGKLTAPEGPAANISLRLQSIESEQSGSGEGLLDSSTTTSEADGSFTFLGVPAGQYTIRATRPARTPSSAIPAELAGNPFIEMALGRGGGGPVALFAQASVSVGSTDVTNVSLILAQGAKVSGKIEFDGAAAQPTPQQLQQFAVSLTRVGGGAPISASGQGRIGQDGQFATQGYAPGRYYVTPTGRGAGAWVVRSAMSGGRDVLSEPLDLRDADVTDVVVTYTDKISQILGTVRAPSGAQSPPPTTLLLFPADYRGWVTRGTNSRFLRTLVVPKGGTFTMGNVVPADYLIAALEDADIPENQDLAFYEALARVSTRVLVKEGERPSVDLAIVKVRR